jgi:hypothetical protein
MDLDRRNVDGSSGNRRSSEDPTLLIGRAAVEAISNSPLMANVRDLSTRIVKGMERPLSQSAVRTARSTFLLHDAGPMLSVFERHMYSLLEPLRCAGRWTREVVELLKAIDALQRGEKDDLWRWVEERNGSAPDTILGAQFRKDVPPIANTVARTMIAFIRFLVTGHWTRLERARRISSIELRYRKLNTPTMKYRDRDYMQALEGYPETPGRMFEKMLRGAIGSVGEDVPLADLRREVQRIIKEDVPSLAQTLYLLRASDST